MKAENYVRDFILNNVNVEGERMSFLAEATEQRNNFGIK